MPDQLPKEEIQRRAKTIRAVYQEYMTKLSALKKRQIEIANNLVAKLEQRKIDKIKKSLEQS